MSLSEHILKLEKWVCIGCKIPESSKYQTPGKIYEVSVTKILDYEIEGRYFTGDDGVEYIFFKGDRDFIPIEEWRNEQIDKALDI